MSEKKWMQGKDLITPERFDLVAKYIFAEAYDTKRGQAWATELYAKHIEAFSGGNYSEPGDEQKNTLDDFIRVFESVIESIRERGFREDISTVEVCQNVFGDYYIANGAHRVSAAAVLNKSVSTVLSKTTYQAYDYLFFRKQLLDQVYLDAMAVKYAEIADRPLHVFLFWPKAVAASGNIKLAEEKLRKNTQIVYEKDVELTYPGYRNLLIQVYQSNEWVGTIENHFQGVMGKVDEIYEPRMPLKVVLLQTESGATADKITQLKEEIRELFGLEKSSCHSSDSRDEMLTMVHLLLNDNSVHALNFGKIDFDKETYQQLALFRKKLSERNIDLNRVIIDSSAVMAVYGMRVARDVDYLTDTEIDIHMENVDHHSGQLQYHCHSLDELLYDPRNYFYSMGMKFISLSVLKEFKKKRNEKKDQEDLRLIGDKEKSTWKSRVAVLIIQFKRRLRNIRTAIRDYLQKHHIYFVTKLWHLLRGKGFR